MIRKICISTLLFCVASIAVAQESFLVSDIRVTGLQRISAGAIFNTLPIKVGDVFNSTESSELIRELYKTGFFKNIEVSTEGSALVIDVVEYPSIELNTHVYDILLNKDGNVDLIHVHVKCKLKYNSFLQVVKCIFIFEFSFRNHMDS